MIAPSILFWLLIATCALGGMTIVYLIVVIARSNLVPSPTTVKNTSSSLRSMTIKQILAAAVGLASGGGALYYFYKFVTFVEPGLGSTGWKMIGLGAISFLCGLIYFLGPVASKEEVEITRY
jgi:hypothetical protein